MSCRVVIPTAGTGSRLGVLTNYINKSLVNIGNQPTISHLINQFPKDYEFVIALGYKGNLVREFLEIAYPGRKFLFVEVDKYEGEGSGLGYSLMCCEQFLQQPFIFLSCDTLVKEEIPPPDKNWMGYAQTENLSPYRTLSVEDNKVSSIHDKGDFSGLNQQAYIGLAGIKDYDSFWMAMRQGSSSAIDHGEAYGLKVILENLQIDAQSFTWFDTGTPSALEKAREAYRQPNEPNILEKENEAIWFVDKHVIKFSDDQSFIKNRVHRAQILKEFTPEILASRSHIYCYQKVDGEVLSKVITLPMFQLLLEHCQNFWINAKLTKEEQKNFVNTCRNFYKNKTLERVELFYHNFDKHDSQESINDEKMPTLSLLLREINWKDLANGLPGRFHGDFHFENILWKEKTKDFIFLDWRQDFGGHLEVGDIYYDLAKLLHGLIVSHELISANAFDVFWGDNNISFDLHRKQAHVECEKYFEEWCGKNGFDFSKVRILTALIYLNIASLHHFPYSLLLYALGKRMLKHELDK